MRTTARSSADVLVGFAPPVPPAAVQRAEAFEATGSAPVVPRRSASVVLLRDSARGPDVYLLHRHARMPFAPSVAAFPGGGLDPADRTGGAASDPVLACALRETAEETGVRLAPGDLALWARWVTPAYEPRRHDTTFFLARLPAGQEALDVSGETERTEWVRPADALAGRASGALALMPPTWSILAELADLPDVAAALTLAEGRTIATVLPRLVRDGERWVFAYEVVG